MSRDVFLQTRVLRAPSNLALNPAREGAATASLGNLGQGLTTLMGKNFFLRSHLNQCASLLVKSGFLVQFNQIMPPNDRDGGAPS